MDEPKSIPNATNAQAIADAYEACTKVDRSALPKSVRVRATALQPPSFAAKVSDYAAFLQ